MILERCHEHVDLQVRTFNPLMNTTSSLYKVLKKKKKKRKRAADEGDKD